MNTTETFTIAEQRGLVMETHVPGQVYTFGDERQGRFVSVAAPRLEELLASFYFVMPHLPPDPGLYDVLTVGRGLPARPPATPSFSDPVRLADVHGGVYIRVTYDAAEGCLGVGMNAGGRSPRLRCLFLPNLPPGLIAGRLLHLLVLVRGDVIFAALDAGDAVPEALGHDQRPSTGRRLHPWGASAEGHWWISSGKGADDDLFLPLPPGFGLSDLKVWIRTGPEAVDSCPPYSGALDHRLLDPAAGEPADADGPVDGFLLDLADELRGLAAGAAAWARRAGDQAERAERLARRHDET